MLPPGCESGQVPRPREDGPEALREPRQENDKVHEEGQNTAKGGPLGHCVWEIPCATRASSISQVVCNNKAAVYFIYLFIDCLIDTRYVFTPHDVM